jgi:hypothetical protein
MPFYAHEDHRKNIFYSGREGNVSRKLAAVAQKKKRKNLVSIYH